MTLYTVEARKLESERICARYFLFTFWITLATVGFIGMLR